MQYHWEFVATDAIPPGAVVVTDETRIAAAVHYFCLLSDVLRNVADFDEEVTALPLPLQVAGGHGEAQIYYDRCSPDVTRPVLVICKGLFQETT